tara:strand:- start:690 stop:1253 length:564 start_codon:yes stop_codon:yes gene_type:complete
MRHIEYADELVYRTEDDNKTIREIYDPKNKWKLIYLYDNWGVKIYIDNEIKDHSWMQALYKAKKKDSNGDPFLPYDNVTKTENSWKPVMIMKYEPLYENDTTDVGVQYLKNENLIPKEILGKYEHCLDKDITLGEYRKIMFNLYVILINRFYERRLRILQPEDDIEVLFEKVSENPKDGINVTVTEN